MDQNKETNLLMGIGDEIELSPEIKKRLRVGTVLQIKEVGELHGDGLLRLKYAIQQMGKDGKPDKKKIDEQIKRWLEILNIIFIEGLTREEFDNSIPEVMEEAVNRFLFD